MNYILLLQLKLLLSLFLKISKGKYYFSILNHNNIRNPKNHKKQSHSKHKHQL